MFAINHAAAALAIKRKYPAVALIWILISVQFMEFVWVAFNLLGRESLLVGDARGRCGYVVSFVPDKSVTANRCAVRSGPTAGGGGSCGTFLPLH